MKSVLLIFCLTIGFALFAQKKQANTAIDRYAQQLDLQRRDHKLHAKALDHMSPQGGAVMGYYAGKELVLVHTDFGAEYGHTAYTFYLRHDSLLLVKETKEFLKFSNDADYENFEAYRKSHTDAKGNTDLSGWPLEFDDNNRYYFHDAVIVSTNISSLKKTKALSNQELTEKSADLLERLQIHYKELEYVRKK